MYNFIIFHLYAVVSTNCCWRGAVKFFCNFLHFSGRRPDFEWLAFLVKIESHENVFIDYLLDFVGWRPTNFSIDHASVQFLFVLRASLFVHCRVAREKRTESSARLCEYKQVYAGPSLHYCSVIPCHDLRGIGCFEDDATRVPFMAEVDLVSLNSNVYFTKVLKDLAKVGSNDRWCTFAPFSVSRVVGVVIAQDLWRARMRHVSWFCLINNGRRATIRVGGLMSSSCYERRSWVLCLLRSIMLLMDTFVGSWR